jgi:tetraacyldisaccharide 4'-kinase
MMQRNLCPVWIGRDRPATAQALLQAHPECDVILSDDGMQHYRLQRDVEIVLVDGKRRFGNGLLLPAGPLREPISRLKTVDIVVINGANVGASLLANASKVFASKLAPTNQNGGIPEYAMQLNGAQFYNLLNPATTLPASAFAGQRLHAIAGIGHPQRFFAHLAHLGLSAQTHPFPDHHCYSAADISFSDADAVLMTEKDAVKCAPFATEQCWVLRVDAQVDPALAQLIIEKIKQ